MKRKETQGVQFAPDVHRKAGRFSKGQITRTEGPYKSILAATSEFYGTWNVASGPISISNGSLSALGYSTADSVNSHIPLQGLIHPDDRATFAARLQNCVAGKVPTFNCEFRMCTKAGLYRWFEIRGKATRSNKRGAATDIAYAAHEIHAEKAQRERMLASNEQLMAIAQASQDHIAVVDPVDFRLLAFNESFARMIVRTHGIRVRHGMRPKDIVPNRAEVWNAFYREVLAKGKISRDYQLPYLNETHHVLAQPLVRDGRVYGIGISAYDITAQKQMEEALRKSEEKFSKAFRETPLALTLTSIRDHRYIEVNDAFTETTGYRRKEVIGKTPHDIGLWVQPEERIELARQVLLSGDVRNAELLFRTKSGEIREGVGSAALIDIDGEPCMLSVIRDVTDRKRAAQALQESEERLRIAIEAGHMYAFEWDIATDIVHRSEQSIHVLDLPGSTSRRTRQELINRVHPDDRASYIRSLHSLSPEKPLYRTVFRMPHRDGRIVWLEESGKGIFESDGRLRKVIGIMSDVTESRESERALRELSRRLITSQEEERRRVARELHDQIGQEAALICVLAQRIDSGAASEEHTMHADVHELYRKIKALSGDISKLSHRLHSSELRFLGLAVAAERLCRDFATQYGIDMEYQPKPLPAKLDSTKSLCFYRVLQEALQNVAKHSHASQVIVELRTVENELILEVTDNGTGFRVNEFDLESGLGLMSMRERLNLIEGRFAITSTPGAGTKLTAWVTV